MGARRIASLVACLGVLLGACSLITNPSRVRFEGDDAGPRMDGGVEDGGVEDGGVDRDGGTREDGGPPPPGCGDGVVDPGTEECDDTNVAASDGCSDRCVVEAGFDCVGGSPTVCAPICGDGMSVGTEACDDGALDACGACNADCTAAGTGSTCGDGAICPSAEACDDTNAASGDGCAGDCSAVEAGWACAGEPSACSNSCGDGIVDGAEECDDGGTLPGDGCGGACAVELGWTCIGGSACSPVCGDGLVLGPEACDDGNTVACGSCDATCAAAGSDEGCGFSVGCIADTDCAGRRCADGVCQSCAADAECPAIAAYCTNSVCNDCNVATHEPCTGVTPYCGGTGGVRFTCVECTEATHCASLICDLGVCRPCENAMDCGGGSWACCGGLCADTQTSTAHCGACNDACPGTCNAGVCI